MRVEITEDTITTGLARLAAALADMSEPMDEIGQLMLTSTQDRISRGVDVDGKPFTPRSATTIARYGKLGLKYGAPLNRSGRMRKGIAFNSGADWMELGSNAIQSAVMQFGAAKGSLGSGAPWGNIPARPYLGVSEDDRSRIHETIEEWLAKVAKT
jgi:phage virion morphogenesis protein